MRFENSKFLIIFNLLSSALASSLEFVDDFDQYHTLDEKWEENLWKGGYCDLEPKCICISSTNTTVFHCEREIHVRLVSRYKKKIHIAVSCNYTITPKLFKHNYYSLLELKRFHNLYIDFKECPVPPESYISLFLPSSTLYSPTNTNEVQPLEINLLNIHCGLRKEFFLTMKHFDGLKALKYLTIICRVLMTLPGNLLIINTPNLIYLQISETRLEYIPDMFFSRLSNLNRLVLKNNRFKKLQNDAFFGLKSLNNMEVTYDELISIDENVFVSVPKITNLTLKGIQLTNLPKSMNNLFNLHALDLSYNLLHDIKETDCTGLSSLRHLNLNYNHITQIDPQCFTYMKSIIFMDISGNSMLKLPDQPIQMDNLRTFIFNDNTNVNLHLQQFLQSSSLRELKMSNSSIVSLHTEILYGLPTLQVVDFSNNNITSLDELLFVKNPKLHAIYLQGNRLSTLPDNVFITNTHIVYLNISSNNISYLPSTLLSCNDKLSKLDLSKNILKTLPENFLSNLSALHYLLLSENKIGSLEKEFFNGSIALVYLDLSHNMIENLSMEIFLPIKNSLRKLYLESNYLLSLPRLEFSLLRFLNLSDNSLEYLPEGAFYMMPRLGALVLSNNRLTMLHNSSLIKYTQKLWSLDLSFNQLQDIPIKMLTLARNLIILNLSYNFIKNFYIESIYNARNLITLNLSNNNISFFGLRQYHDHPLYSYVKFLNLSNNQLSLNYSKWIYDNKIRTWGRESPFVLLREIQELLLANNTIDTIHLDWRNYLHDLRILDLRYNKFTYLTHQDMLFSSTSPENHWNTEHYHCPLTLTVDLRDNQIKGVELPSTMELVTRNKTKGMYSRATILLENNPFVCGCELINLLRVLDNDIVLTSEIERTEGLKLLLPAKIDVGNLSCWEPVSVRGKKLTEPETWIHRLLPMFGLCELKPLT